MEHGESFSYIILSWRKLKITNFSIVTLVYTGKKCSHCCCWNWRVWGFWRWTGRNCRTECSQCKQLWWAVRFVRWNSGWNLQWVNSVFLTIKAWWAWAQTSTRLVVKYLTFSLPRVLSSTADWGKNIEFRFEKLSKTNSTNWTYHSIAFIWTVTH